MWARSIAVMVLCGSVLIGNGVAHAEEDFAPTGPFLVPVAFTSQDAAEIRLLSQTLLEAADRGQRAVPAESRSDFERAMNWLREFAWHKGESQIFKPLILENYGVGEATSERLGREQARRELEIDALMTAVVAGSQTMPDWIPDIAAAEQFMDVARVANRRVVEVARELEQGEECEPEVDSPGMTI